MKAPDLGQFSASLAVKDMEASLKFYQALGFEVIMGGHDFEAMPDTDATAWRILKSGNSVVGLFKGMFENNLMTFNPTDARGVQKHVMAQGITPIQEIAADAGDSGPCSLMLQDPDGNMVLIDQH